MIKHISQLTGAYNDKTGAIIGTGPSLHQIKREDFNGVDVIITINGAVKLIRNARGNIPIYTMQKDACSYNKNLSEVVWCEKCDGACWKPEPIQPEILLIHFPESIGCWPEYPLRYAWNNADYGLPWHNPSFMACLKIMEIFGVAKIKIVSFDSCTTGSIKHINSDKEDRGYIADVELIKDSVKNCTVKNIEWITPQ